MSHMANVVIYVTRDPSLSPALAQNATCSDLEKGLADSIEDTSWFESTEIINDHSRGKVG
jgi:hypothetical protein